MRIFHPIPLISLLILLIAMSCASDAPEGTALEPTATVVVTTSQPALPTAPPTVVEQPSAVPPTQEIMPTATPTAESEPTPSPTPSPEPTFTPTTEPTATEAPPTPVVPIAIVQGQFNGVGGDYSGSGLATAYQLDGENRVLRFSEFSVSSGPGLVVLLSNNRDVHLTRNIREYVELGDLQSFTGDQQYPIPPDLDLTEYSVAVIYCKPFNAVFATATLR